MRAREEVGTGPLVGFQVLSRASMGPIACDPGSLNWTGGELCKAEATSAQAIESVLVRAGSKEEARSLVEGGGYVVHSVGPGRPVIEPGQQIYNLMEAATVLRVSSSTITKLMAAGKLPKAPNGDPRFTRQRLLEAAEVGL